MIIAAALGLLGGLYLFHVRGTLREPVADLGSIVLLSIPEFLWGLFLLFLFLRFLPMISIFEMRTLLPEAQAHATEAHE